MSTNLKNILLVLTLIGLCFMIKCKLDKDKEVALLNEKSKSAQSVNESNSGTEEKNLESHNIESQTADTIIQRSDSLSNIELDNKKESSTEVKTQEEKDTSPQVEKKKKPKKKVAKRIAKIEFEEMIWNFGEIVEGDIIKKKFKFTNTGKAPLQIISTDASCGCARPTIPFLDIAPGESSEIGITYNSVNKEGEQKPEIIIESNTSPKHNVLKLFGTVKPKPIVDKKKDLDSLKVKQDTTAKN